MGAWGLAQLAAIASLIVLADNASAEVNFPLTRNAVGPGEFYTLDITGEWITECIRDKNSEDYCSASRTIGDLAAGIELDFSVTPYIMSHELPEVDVDVAPAGGIDIIPYSSSSHYTAYSAAITEIDGNQYDGYWCPLVGTGSCERGPNISRNDLGALLHGEIAVISIYTKESSPEHYTELTRINVDISDLFDALEKARLFNAEIYGINPDHYESATQMCDLSVNGVQRRISYTFDENFDFDNTSLRESIMGGVTGGSCPGYVALAYLTPDLTTAQRAMFCLDYDKDRDTINGLQLGERNPYMGCKSPSRTFCERVNAAKDAGIGIVSFAAGAVGAAAGATSVTGTTVVAHSSGAAILTGSGGYVAGTLGTIGTTTLGILTAPLTVTAATVSVVAVGSAVYVCSE